MSDFPPIGPDAPCRTSDPETFFGETAADVARAKLQCAGCPYIDPCLEWAVTRGEFGVWAGTSESDRRRIRKERGIVAQRIRTDGFEERRAAVLALAAQGLNGPEIAVKTGMSHQAVDAIRRRAREAS